MTRTYGLKSAHDLLGKLERDATLLKAEVSSDRFFNFVVTAYHLTDWIKEDPSVPQSAKNDLNTFMKTPEIQICRDLANASKHFELDKKRNPLPTVDTAKSKTGYGVGRFGAGAYGVGEESITICLTTGNMINGLDLMEKTLIAWKNFFKTHRM